MSQQLTYLAYTAFLTSVMWVPYILDSFMVKGLMATFQNPQDSKKSLSAWAIRLKAAHYNAVENLVVVGILVLIAEHRSSDVGSLMMIYLLARIAHYVAYGMGVPVARTVLFLVGFGVQVAMFLKVIA